MPRDRYGGAMETQPNTIAPLMRVWHPNASEEELIRYSESFREFLLVLYRIYRRLEADGYFSRDKCGERGTVYTQQNAMNGYYAYIRVSTQKQGQHGSSLQEQRAAIEAYAKRHSLTIVEWFEEQETAAKQGRTKFTQMLRLLQKGKACGVLIHKIDRSARNLRDWADLGELIDRGIHVHFVHETLDLQSRGGRLAADIQAIVAADFIRNLRQEVRKGFEGRLKQGLYPLPAPIGYTNEGPGMPKQPDPLTAPLVRRAFELYATGKYNLRALSAELFQLGLRSQGGGRIGITGFSTILNNEFYIGILHIRRTGERYRGIHQPLIPKSLFDRVKGILSGKIKNRGLKHDVRYRKTLRCTACGYNMIGELQKGHVYYRCHTTTCRGRCIRETFVDAEVRREIGRINVRPVELPLWAAEFKRLEEASGNSQQDLLKGLTLVRDQIDTRLARLTDAYIDRMIDKATFEERKKALIHERAAIQEKLDELSEKTDHVHSLVRNFLELIKALSDNTESTYPTEKRDALKKATSNWSYDGKNLVVDWLDEFQPMIMSPILDYGAPAWNRTMI